jgi:hypothetical protein
MSVFFQIGKTCARGTKQAAEKKAFGGRVGKFFQFMGRNPGLATAGAAGLGLGAAGTAAGAAGAGVVGNELMAGHGLPHFGGSASQPLWHPSSHNMAVNPHTQGWGTAALRAITRPLQTYRSLAGTHPEPTLDSITSGGLQGQKLKYNPTTGKLDVVGGSYDMHPLYKQRWDSVQKDHQMFSKLFGLNDPAAPGATPAATPPAAPKPAAVPQVVRNAFGPLHMNDYSKVPNIPMPSVH